MTETLEKAYEYVAESAQQVRQWLVGEEDHQKLESGGEKHQVLEALKNGVDVMIMPKEDGFDFDNEMEMKMRKEEMVGETIMVEKQRKRIDNKRDQYMNKEMRIQQYADPIDDLIVP